MKTATLFGATGFVGSELLQELLNDPVYGQVTAVVRKPLSISHPKLKVVIGDYNSLPTLKDQLACDEVFIALGTTKKNTPDQRLYYQIEHDYPVLAAKLCKERGATSVFIVSTVGANADSSIFYVRGKGEMERDVTALNFSYTHIFRPSMIMGHRQEERRLEKSLIQVWGAFNPLFMGPLSSYKGIAGKDIAKAMRLAAKQPTDKIKIYHWKDMNALLHQTQ